MARLLKLCAISLLTIALSASTAGAITFGTVDGDLHPNTGALLADHEPGSPGPDLLCSGTLIDERVFLTAAHCTDRLAGLGIQQVWVTFAPSWDEDATSTAGLFAGTYVTHPEFAPGGQSDTHDIAVVLLGSSPGIAPARLPAAGLLDRLEASHQLDEQVFTTVGYGTVREDKSTGPNALFFDGVRRYTQQSGINVRKSWFLLSMQPSTGDGGTCFGDSGGPHFLGGVDSDLVVSLTVSGDSQCRATDESYRLDTPSAREFLADFVALP